MENIYRFVWYIVSTQKYYLLLLPAVIVVVVVRKHYQIKFSESQPVDENTWVLALTLLLNFVTFSKNFSSLGTMQNEELELDGVLVPSN